MKLINSLGIITILVLLMSINFSCTSSDKGDFDENKTEELDTVLSTIIEVGDALFSIPSPFQASILIKESGITYDAELLNTPTSVASYSTNFQKALNLGVYGADLGYATIYEQPQDAIKYFKAVEEIANDLGVATAFNKKTINSIKNNIGNRDSLLTIVSDAYRASDEYLKSNARTDISSLILAGGWIEGLYLVVNSAKKNFNQKIINRIGEQKTPLENLIKILTPYYDQKEYTQLIDDLILLAYEFDGVDIKYNYVKPTVDLKNKMTYINSTTEIIISKYQLEAISKQLNKIRNNIIGKK